MPAGRPDLGTVVIALLLLLCLFFAGNWIIDYAQGRGAPWGLLPWFGGAAAVIVVIGLATYLRGAR